MPNDILRPPQLCSRNPPPSWARKILCGKLPVQEAVNGRDDVVLPAVLIVEVVGMLPDVQGEQRGRARGKKVLAVGRRHNLQLALFGDEPRPAAAELPHRRLGECLPECVVASEGAFDPLGVPSRWLPAAFL